MSQSSTGEVLKNLVPNSGVTSPTAVKDVESPSVSTRIFKQTLVKFRPHYPFKFLATFSSDGQRIISSSSDSPTILIWDAVNGDPIKGPVCFSSRESPTFIRLSQNGQWLLSGSGDARDQIALLWHIDTRQAIPIGLKICYNDLVALSRDGMKVFIRRSGRDVVAENITMGERAHHDGTHLGAYSSNGEKILFVDATTGQLNILQGERLIVHFKSMHDRVVESLAFSRDGTHYVLGLSDGRIQLRDSDTGTILSESDYFGGHTGRVSCVAFSPDGKWIVSGSFDRTICIWDARSGALVSRPLTRHLDNVRTVTFSPDGLKILSTSDDSTIRIWS
ncbi:hypothetical protein PILCRDRAFT_8676 [Piloderma croceum F 1598]|uniref:Uncharacterized protein n=1 Tax=Piloderma croceum (strain F 1598) TaxID=765440 RepID=A0A0C3B5Z9_PILCF|nr:hypothetical protein PILCRDRAFT_8676 [Piloderma croceum F 1598]